MKTRAIHSLAAIIMGSSLAIEHLHADIEINPFANHSSSKNDDNQTIAREINPAGEDVLRFENDILHGDFLGINAKGLIWHRPDLDGPITFKKDSLRQVVFNGGNASEIHPPSPYVSMVNGDRIPGEIVSLNGDHLILNSSIVGEMQINRDQITSISPNPFDGQLYYAGPFTKEGWTVLDHPLPEEETDEKKPKKAEEEKTEPKPIWAHRRATFLSSKTHRPLARLDGLPDCGRLKFKIRWKNSLSMSIAFHADFTRPIFPEPDEEEKKEDGEEKKKDALPLEFEKLSDRKKNNAYETIPWLDRKQTTYAGTYGSSYVLTINPSYPSLSRCSFNAEGTPRVTRLQVMRNNISLQQNGEAEIDLRFDRKNNLIMLFIDGKYAAQWSDMQGYAGIGDGFAFISNGRCLLGISDIFVTSWNGLLDSAVSMEHEERDVVLLTNGTDRFSGTLTQISGGNAHLQTDYAEVKIPLADLSEIKLKRNSIADENDEKFEWSESPAVVLFQPIGRISLNPLSSTKTTLEGSSTFLGPLKLELKSATLLQFQADSFDITDWFDDL